MLFTYVSTHLANHAVGLASLAAAESVRLGFTAFWRSPPATVLFYTALGVHITLAFAALYERRALRMPPMELVRIVLGFCIPFLLAGHFAATRLAYELFGQDDRYARVVWAMWSNEDRGLSQLALMIAAWVHGCIGIHFVLRHRAGYQRRFHLVFAGAVLLPVLAALGFTAMARELSLQALDPAWHAAQIAAGNVIDAAHRTVVGRAADGIAIFFACALGGMLLARAVRSWKENRPELSIELTYPGGEVIRVPRGWSVLEASRAHGIAHLALCGGRARCSTCRVHVTGNPAHCPPPLRIEQRTLERISAPPGVRLACQLRPTGDIGVTPLLAPASADAPHTQFGVEREVVVLFVDLRRWTSLSEQQLPHDLAYLLDRYFAAVGDAVREAGGIPNQFIGDSVMAIFGMDNDSESACRQALAAARGIETRMETTNESMRRDFGHSMEFGMGIHAGRAAVGEVGYQDTRTFTAVGDAVNTASRLQELCKDYGVRLVISDRVAQGAGLDTSVLAAHMLAIRGRSSELCIYAIPSPGTLPHSAIASAVSAAPAAGAESLP